MSKLLVNNSIPYNIVDEKNLVSLDRVYSPVSKIICNNNEVYFNPFTYMTKKRHIVLPGVEYNYSETPRPIRIMSFKSSPSALFNLSGSGTDISYIYSKPIKSFFVLTGNKVGDSTSYLPSGVGVDGCTYWYPRRRFNGDYYYGLAFSKLSKGYPNSAVLFGTRLNLCASMEDTSLDIYDILEISLTDPINYSNIKDVYTFKDVSAAMSLLAPTGDPNDGMFLDIIINCHMYRPLNKETPNNIYGFYAARVKINLDNSLRWYDTYSSPSFNSIGLKETKAARTDTNIGNILKTFMLSKKDFLDTSRVGNTSAYLNNRLYAIWS